MGAICFGAYRLAGILLDKTPESSTVQYEPDYELTEVSIHGGFNPPDRARYEEKKREASRRSARESSSHPDIWEVVLRHQMLANEYGRISVDLKEQDVGDFFLAMAHRWGIGVWLFHDKDRFPRATVGPFKGTFRFDELLDRVFEGTDCAWYPLSETYITYECGAKTYAATPKTWFMLLVWDTIGPKNHVVGNNLCDTGAVPCRFDSESACLQAMDTLSPRGSDPEVLTPQRVAMNTWLHRRGAFSWEPGMPYYVYSCSAAPPADLRYLEGNYYSWQR